VRFALLIFLLPLVAGAQAPAAATLTGTLLERDPQPGPGEFSVRAPTNQVFRYRFDSKTTIDSDGHVIEASRLQPGEKVEVTSDQPPGSTLRYAIAIHALAPAAPLRAAPDGRRPYAGLPDRQMQSGDLSLTGVVSSVGDGRLTLRLREGGEQVIRLLPDTSFVADGRQVEAAELKATMRVFVEAGKPFSGEVEAYRVVWGGIMQPR